MNSPSWLIIGGGIHGVHIAARLIGDGRVATPQVRILDPADALLARWRACTATVGMTHLRSPSVHHLDLDPFSLRRFAGKRKRRKPGVFAPPYDRPALDLFNAHCDRLIEEHGLGEIHVRARAAGIQLDRDGATVTTETGSTLRATHVVLAVGASEQPDHPSWAPPEDPRIAHIFESGFALPKANAAAHVAVVGGGISAAQVALRLTGEGHRVHLISRHALRQHQFDSDPGWLGPKFMTRFSRERNMNRRRAMIVEARHRGSVPPDIRCALRHAFDTGRILWHEAEVREFAPNEATVHLRLSNGNDISVERVLLATGLSTRRPGGTLVDSLVDRESLPCAECGYPIVDSALRWHPRVHVTGPLAELELGPASRNIAGARHAGDRIIAALRSDAEPDERTLPGGFSRPPRA